MTWSIPRLCVVSSSITSRLKLGDPTNICWITVKKRQISQEICQCLIATERISAGSAIWKREVQKQLKLHRLHIDHITIWSELKNLNRAKVVGYWMLVVGGKTGQTAAARVFVGWNQLPQSGTGLKQDPEPTRTFGTVANTIYPPDLDCRPFAWPVQPLHIPRRIIMSHNSGTKIEKTLTLSKIGTWIDSHRDTASNLTTLPSMSLVTHELWPFLRLNQISMWSWTWDAICTVESIRVREASDSCLVTNWALSWAGPMLCLWVTVVSRIPPSFDKFMVEKTLSAFAIVRAQ